MPDLLTFDDNGVRTLTLNRPDALNAMTTAMFDGFRRELRAAAEDPSVRCVVVTAAGRGFCAGVDLHDFDPGRGLDERRNSGAIPCFEELERFSKPLIAAVDGVAVGFGTTVLLHCDIVVASPNARFRLPFVHLGLAPEAGSSFLLPLRVGTQDAAQLLFTGSWLDAERAQSIGLVWRLVDAETLSATVDELAKEIAGAPLDSLVATKRLLLNSRSAATRSARCEEIEEYTRLLKGEAHRSAVARFRSKTS